MRASRPTAARKAAAVPVWPQTQNLFVGAGFIPPAGVCAAVGLPGRCEHRPLQGFVVTQGRGFPVGRGIFPVPQGGRSRPPHIGGLELIRLRRRGVRRDGGIPPYGRPEGGGRPCETQNLFVGAGFIPPGEPCAAAGCGGMRASRPTDARVGCGCPVSRVIFGRFVGEGHAPPAGPCRTANIHGRAMALPYEPAQMPPPSGWPKA